MQMQRKIHNSLGQFYIEDEGFPDIVYLLEEISNILPKLQICLIFYSWFTSTNQHTIEKVLNASV